jgi:hypothetical protein
MQKLLFVCFLFFVVPGLVFAVTIEDNFDDNSLNSSLWVPFNIGSGDPGVSMSVSEINGQLEAEATVAPLPIAAQSAVAIAGVSLLGTIYGDFDVQAHYEMLDPLVGPNDEPFVGILLSHGQLLDDPYLVGLTLDKSLEGNKTYLAGIEDDEFRIPTNDTEGLLRFTRIGNLVSAYYWGPSDTNWQLIRQANGSADPIKNLGLGIFNETNGTTVFAAFDNFSLTADQFIPTLEPTYLYFPQIADGEGLQTTLTISNPGDNEAAGTLRFFTPGGSEWALSINSTVGSAFPFTLPAHGSARFTTSGTGSIATGWASLESVRTLSGVATFDIRSQDTLIQTIGVLGTPVAKRLMVPADYDSRANMGLAIINTSGSNTLTVSLSLVGEDGVVIQTSTDPDYQNIPAHGYVTKFVSEAFPNIPSTFKGNLIAEANGNGVMAVIGLTQKDGLYSAIPVANPSLAVAKRVLGEWAFVSHVSAWGREFAPSFSIRAIEDDSSGSGQIYAWGYDYQYHGSLLVNWDESRQSYVGINSNPDYPWSNIYIFNFANENTISGCYYYQDQYYPDPLNHSLGNCNNLTGTRIIQ